MEPRYTGVGEYTLNLLENLFLIDSQNQYLLFYNSHGDYQKNLPKFDFPNVAYKGFNYPNKLLNISLGILKKPYIDQMLGGVDLFFAPHISFLSLSKKCKKVITVHDLSFVRSPEFFPAKRKFWFKMFGAECRPHDFDIILADSENTKRDIVQLYGIGEEKIKVVYLGLESDFRPIDNNKELESVREKYKLPEKFILYLGTLEPRKNIVSLIQAYEKLKDPEHNLVIAGNPGWLYKDIYKTAKNSRAAERIKFIGYVDRNDKACLYNLADLFVYLSFYEGFGFPPLEAMACGTPVVASYTSSLGEIIGSGGVLVNPYNISEITTTLNEIILDNQVKQSLAQAGILQSKKFNWTTTARETLDTFKTL